MKTSGSFFSSKVGEAILKNFPIVLSIIAIVVFAFGGRGQTTDAFTTPGTYTWTVPSCVTSITVQVWGAGGGGGGSIAIVRNTGDGEACSGAGGGGGGGFTSRTFSVIPGQVYNVVVGANGIAGIAGAGTWNGGITTPPGLGGTGGTSSFSNFGINLQATGGTGGAGAGAYNNSNPPDINVIGNGGTGGVGSGGTANFIGGNGASGYVLNLSTDKSGGGGGAAGPGGNGGNAPGGGSYGIVDNNNGGIGSAPGGNGGASRMNNIPSDVTKNGGNGNNIGAGGGGGLNHKEGYGTMTGAVGGTGARGEVRIIYTGIASPTVAGPGTEICSGSSATVTASGSFSTYTWNTGQSGSSVSVSPTTNTTYTVTGTDASGCTASNSIAISVKPSPNTSAGVNDATICSGQTINLSAGPSPVSSTTTINFEGNSLTVLNGSEYNKWYQGTTAKCNGTNGLYIGTVLGNNNYANATSQTVWGWTTWTQNPSVVFAYVDVPITECNATLSFNWKCAGKSTDNLSVWMVPNSTTLTPGTALVNGGSIVKIGGDYWNSNVTCNAVTGLNLVQGWVSIGQTVRVVFQWRNTGNEGSNTAANNAAMIDDIVITQTSPVTYSWSSSATSFSSTAQNPTNSPSASTTYTVTATGCNGCTKSAAIGVVVDPCGLPIELLSFQGKCNLNSKQFSWSTASESNNDYFVLEQSENGADFFSVGQIDGAGNSSSLLNYHFELLNNNGDYFRLKQVDFDGAFTYSDIIYVGCDDNGDQSIFFPNPFDNELNIDLSEMEERFSVAILDVNGRLIKSVDQGSLKSTNAMKIDLSELAKGIYYIELTSIETTELLKKGKVIKL